MDEFIGVITGGVIFLTLIFGAAHILGLLAGPSRARRRASRAEGAAWLAASGDSGGDAGMMLTLLLGARNILGRPGGGARRRDRVSRVERSAGPSDTGD